MRFHRKDSPKVGDVRIRERFLWFPKRIGNEVRWLEKAKYSEQLFSCWTDLEWVAKQWIDIKERKA